MVCPLGSGRMETLTRFLVAGNIQQTASEEAGHHKLAAQYIQRELREADEANLIDEEDMHVFGLRPLTDPLHLVCCNACKKPIKASQYVAHSELCKSLISAEEIALEVNDGTVHKKRPRKERKKSLTAYTNKPISVRKKAKPELLDNGFAASSCCSEELHSTVSFPKDKRISSHLNVASVRNSSMVNPGPVDCSEGAILHQEENSKMLIVGNRQLLADFGAVNGVTKSWSANSREAIPGEDHQERSTAGSDNTGSRAVAVKIATQVQNFCSKAEDVPHPLATKMYYSQRVVRLRSALSYMYHEASSNESGNEFACPKVLKSNVMPADILCHSNNSHILINYQQEKAVTISPCGKLKFQCLCVVMISMGVSMAPSVKTINVLITLSLFLGIAKISKYKMLSWPLLILHLPPLLLWRSLQKLPECFVHCLCEEISNKNLQLARLIISPP